MAHRCAARARGVLAKAFVVQLQLEIPGVGEGFIGQILRLHLQLDRPEAGAPATLIVKLPTLLHQNRALGEMLGAYEREVRFYEELSSHVPLRAPRCFYSAMDPGPFVGREARTIRFLESFPGWLMHALYPVFLWLAGRSKRRYVLLLEDLAPARVGDQIAGCTVARTLFFGETASVSSDSSATAFPARSPGSLAGWTPG